MDINFIIPYLPAIGGACGQLARQVMAIYNRYLQRKQGKGKKPYFNLHETISKMVLGAVGGAVLGASAYVFTNDPLVGFISGFSVGWASVNAVEKGREILDNLFKSRKKK